MAENGITNLTKELLEAAKEVDRAQSRYLHLLNRLSTGVATTTASHVPTASRKPARAVAPKVQGRRRRKMRKGLADDILAALAKAKGPMLPGTIATAIKHNANSVGTTLYRLASQGKAKRAKDGSGWTTA